MTADNTTSSDAGNTYITWAAVGFVVTAVAVFAIGALFGPDGEGGYPITTRAEPVGGGVFRVTVDASNNKSWVSVDLGLGRTVATGLAADIRLRRYQIQAPHGAADLGKIPLKDAIVDADIAWQLDAAVDGEQLNPAMARWYIYSYWTHLLKPQGHTFAVRRHDGTVAVLRLDSYYCKPEGSGCVTIRYLLK